jgi:hypothetical protein
MPRLAVVTSIVAVVACAGLSAPAYSQSNDNDYTPLGSRIKRDRQFPLDLPVRWDVERSKVNRERSKAMLGQFTRCLYRRSNEKSLDLLARTDLGFTAFEQIDMDADLAMRIFGFNDCLRRVANSNGTGVALRFYPGGLRQWLLQEAYFSRYPDEASWVKPGNVVDERVYPLSAGTPAVHAMMDFADCVLTSDPYGADYFFRTPGGSPEEKAALESLVPTLGPCLPDGMQMEINPNAMRVWLGEALWHASNNNAPAGGGPGLSAPPAPSPSEATE